MAKWSGLRDKARDCVSRLIDQARVEPEHSVLVTRAKFGDVPVLPVRAVENHTHGTSAANRSSGSATIDVIGRTMGADVWFYQRSAADVRKGRLGSRSFFWCKDLNARSASFAPNAKAIVAMVDVDQYVDMNWFLCRWFRPVILYTFQPSSVARSDGEYSYTFDSCDRVDYGVSGGGRYRHMVWNYTGDAVKATWRFLGIPLCVSVYQLERRFMDEDHQLLLLAPLAQFWGPAAILASVFLEGEPLRRLRVAKDGFLRMLVKTSQTVEMVTGVQMGYSVARVPARVDDELASVTRTSKVGLTLPMVKAKMGESRDGAEILFEYHKMVMKRVRPNIVNVVDDYVRDFQWFDDEWDPEAKPSMVSFMDPLLDGAFCPVMSKSNDRRAVDQRILEQRNTTVLTPHLVKIVEEFVDLFWGDIAGKLLPVDEDYLREKQNRPTQLRILNEAEYLVATLETKSFMKREAYPKVADPRIISTINGVDKRDYSLYMYAVGDVLKTKSWYAFGKTPREVAERVAEICETALSIVNTDFSRMDGRVSHVLRYLEERVMLKGFATEHHEEMLRLMETQRGLRGKTKFGVSYDTGLSRLSGSPETSSFNTIANAFTAYAAYRAMRGGMGDWVAPEEAYARLGIYGGDDGISADVPPGVYVKTAAKVGQVLEVEPIKRGDVGVKFLSRQYGPEVWWGCVDSCCDFARCLSKFHVTVHMPNNVSKESKLRDKAFSLWLSDGNSPVVGEFVSQVLNVADCDDGWLFTNLCGAWMPFGVETEKQYPNEHGKWMDDLFNRQLPSFDRTAFGKWLQTASTLEVLLTPPQFAERIEAEMKKEGEVVVDGDLLSNLSIDTSTEDSSSKSAEVKDKTPTSKAKKHKPSPRTGRYRGVVKFCLLYTS